MTSLFPLRKPTYPQSFILIYGFLFELWVSNLNEEKKKKKKKKKKKMKNSAHHSSIHLWWGGPWPSLYTKHYSALWYWINVERISCCVLCQVLIHQVMGQQLRKAPQVSECPGLWHHPVAPLAKISPTLEPAVEATRSMFLLPAHTSWLTL